MVDTTIRVIVDPSGAVRGTRVVNRSLTSVEARAQATTTAVQFLTRAIGILGIGFGVAKIASFADTFTQLQNRLKVAGIETDNLASATKRLQDISNRTRTDLETNVSLFQRLGIAQGQLGASTEELFVFTEAVASGLAVQGAAAGTARGAILQLSQAVGSTIVRGEEFNSILEGAFPIALAAAKGLDAAGGSVARLRSLVIEGKVSSVDFFRAIIDQADSLEEQFARTTPTISQAFTVLNNALIISVGEFDQAEGASEGFARSILKLATNLDIAAGAAAVLLAALAPAILASIASGLRTMALAAAGFVIALGPIGIFASIVASLATAFIFFADKIQPVTGLLLTLKDVGQAVFNILLERANKLIDIFDNAFPEGIISSSEIFTRAFGFMGDVVSALFTRIKGFANGVINSFRSILEAGATAIQGITALGAGDLSGALGAFEGLGGRIKTIFEEDIVGSVIDSGKNLISEFATAVLQEANRIQVARDSVVDPGGGGGGDGGGGGREKPEEFTSKQATALRQLQDALDPIAAAQRELTESQNLLNAAMRTGAIGIEEFSTLSIKLDDSLRDAIDPFAAINRELQEEHELLGLSSRAREVEIELRGIENDLRQKGKELSDSEKDSLRDTLQDLQALNEAQETQRQLFEDIRGPQEEYGKQLQALDALLMDGLITFDEFDEKVRELKLGLLDQNDDLASGFERGLLRASESFNDFASLAESAVTDAFQGMEDALVDFVQTGKLDFKSLADSILQDIIRITVRKSITGPLAGLLGGGGDSPGGGPAGIGGLLGGLFNSIPGFQGGGKFTVPGVGGTDERLVSFKATPGEEVSVSTPGSSSSSGGGPMIINASFNFPGGDATSIRKNQTQVAADASQALREGFRRNG